MWVLDVLFAGRCIAGGGEALMFLATARTSRRLRCCWRCLKARVDQSDLILAIGNRPIPAS